MLKYLAQIWHSKDLRNKILFTLFIVFVFRLMTHITIPGVNLEALKIVFERNELLGVFSLLTGGSAENFSIVLMGLSPYINASIIMQLMTVISPRLEAISKEGEEGRRRVNKYTRWLTLPLAFLQSFGMIRLINASSPIPIIENLGDPMVILPIMLTISAGTVILMWLGELISEKGIGNGISIMIFASIIAGVPTVLASTLALAEEDPERLIPLVMTLLLVVFFTLIVVLVTEGQRRIPITYAGHTKNPKGEKAHIPIRVNQAGMIPIIFAVSMVTFPSVMGQFLVNAQSEWLQSIGNFFINEFNSQSALYLIFYFLLIIAFTYFYVSVTFNPETVAENIQKRGGFIPGIRPGKQTAEYLGVVSNRLNLWGGVMIAGIAIAPILIQQLFQSSATGSIPIIVSGASLIIIVGVVLDLIRQINAQLISHHYERFS
ncbi:MAG: preprotein translocase subunit SecY [Candidatus Peregrinibacteria bacterium]|nr:preprotein translocase subunit SecY [Candidatus Peregrinibacteria bacterium]